MHDKKSGNRRKNYFILIDLNDRKVVKTFTMLKNSLSMKLHNNRPKRRLL